MAKLQNQPKSQHFSDRTQDGPIENFFHTLNVMLNPAYATRNIVEKLQDKGYLPPPTTDNRFGNQNYVKELTASGAVKQIAADLKKIMGNTTLIDPHVMMDDSYGDLLSPNLHNFDKMDEYDRIQKYDKKFERK